MATAKIATLAIRTLAKPIATQIKHQAQSHQRFRAVCISLAQFMHRTEVALRSNLLASSTWSSKDSSGAEKPKVRPLNEAKAVTNGANALAEGFLFALAAGLILGESYRGSRSRAAQRDRTEEGLEEMRLIIQTMAERVGVDYDEIQEKVREAEEIQRRSSSSDGKKDSELSSDGDEPQQGPSMAEMLYKQREAMERERDRLQHAVNVLLRMALKSGWIQGAESLHLQSILDGTDEHHEAPAPQRSKKGQQVRTTALSPSSQRETNAEQASSAASNSVDNSTPAATATQSPSLSPLSSSNATSSPLSIKARLEQYRAQLGSSSIDGDKGDSKR